MSVVYFFSTEALMAPNNESRIPIMATAVYLAYSGGISKRRKAPMIKPNDRPIIIKYTMPPSEEIRNPKSEILNPKNNEIYIAFYFTIYFLKY